MLTDLGDRPIRLTYDRGDLEFMAPSFNHERCAGRLGRLVETLAEELDIDILAGRSTTFKRKDLERGLEPDECFYIRNEPLIRGKKELDLLHDPPPDLAIEVDISRSFLDRQGIYASLAVPEIWRFDDEALTVYRLRPDGDYEPAPQSTSFPLLPLAEVAGLLHQTDPVSDTAMVRFFRAWIRERILPAWRSAGNGPGGAFSGSHPDSARNQRLADCSRRFAAPGSVCRNFP